MDSKISNEEIINSLINNCSVNDNIENSTTGDTCQESTSVDHTAASSNKTSADRSTTNDIDTDDEKSASPINDIDDEVLQKLEESMSETDREKHKNEAINFKLEGNKEFNNGNYYESINFYTKALNTCPSSYKMERSTFYGNRAAAKVKLDYDETAIEDCTKAIDLNSNYLKAYVRRAKLYEKTDKLDESLKDFTKILELDPTNSEARAASIRLPPLINERNEKMKEEMLGKLKDLGNLVLKPFGLSTENFKLQQDPNTGGYSVNFQQNRKS